MQNAYVRFTVSTVHSLTLSHSFTQFRTELDAIACHIFLHYKKFPYSHLLIKCTVLIVQLVTVLFQVERNEESEKKWFVFIRFNRHCRSHSAP